MTSRSARPLRDDLENPLQRSEIREFWSAHPCGDNVFGAGRRPAGGLREVLHPVRHGQVPPGIPHSAVPRPSGRPRQAGAGDRSRPGGRGRAADPQGCPVDGGDLTETAVRRTKTRLALRDLPHDGPHQASVLDLPYPEGSFDLVFSHGVLHHVPDVLRAQREIHRVLRPGGRLVVMLYARWSLNYLVSIAVLRRAALPAAYPLVRAGLLGGSHSLLDAHVAGARRCGLLRYLRLPDFTHRNTDGPDNPYSQVYDVRRVRRCSPSSRWTTRRSGSCTPRRFPCTAWSANGSWAGTCGCI
ncbi:class I SAM-dependent methyltransferase [Streptomyces sp. 2112.3]|uniref:class I SAM-dependent methyltransferase n=1 Tax=Streptomyces sp. 2112.3 TaxID=1881023 RepID=UPI00210EF04E|nr:class I SAM-dependent methyltransferase [Streptomyces sp. 2112.3]